MERAILKTLIYADIFGFPLKAWEIHKWLIGKKATLKQIEKALKSKNLEFRIKNKGGYFFLKRSNSLVRQRINREKISQNYLKKAKFVAFFLKIIPWIKLVGVSGSLALMNARKSDDIDFFIVAQRKRLWIARLGIILVLSLLNIRRKASDSKKNSIRKICVNLLLDEDSLSFKDKNIYLAHEILQMVPLWHRDGIYSKFLEMNNWVFKFLPNWFSGKNLGFKIYDSRKINKSSFINHKLMLNYLETLSKLFQLKYMRQPKGMEKITETALYFHPEDHGMRVLKTYNKKIKKLK